MRFITIVDNVIKVQFEGFIHTSKMLRLYYKYLKIVNVKITIIHILKTRYMFALKTLESHKKLHLKKYKKTSEKGASVTVLSDPLFNTDPPNHQVCHCLRNTR